MISDMTFQTFADKMATDKDLVPLDVLCTTLSKDDISQRYPASMGLITIMKPKINRVDKISTPSFIEDIFDDDNGFALYSEIEVPDELIIYLIDELYGIDTPEKLNNQQISIIKVLAVYIIISTYTA